MIARIHTHVSHIIVAGQEAAANPMRSVFPSWPDGSRVDTLSCCSTLRVHGARTSEGHCSCSTLIIVIIIIIILSTSINMACLQLGRDFGFRSIIAAISVTGDVRREGLSFRSC